MYKLTWILPAPLIKTHLDQWIKLQGTQEAILFPGFHAGGGGGGGGWEEV